MDKLVQKILEANPRRKAKNLDRRIMKHGEEYGEVVQAYLAVTSKNNLKQKTWDDVREELIDTLILNLDILLTEMPDQKGMTLEARLGMIYDELDRKLAKWHSKMSERQTEVDDAE